MNSLDDCDNILSDNIEKEKFLSKKMQFIKLPDYKISNVTFTDQDILSFFENKIKIKFDELVPNLKSYGKPCFIIFKQINEEYLKFIKPDIEKLSNQKVDFIILDNTYQETIFHNIINSDLYVINIFYNETIDKCCFMTTQGSKNIFNKKKFSFSYLRLPIFRNINLEECNDFLLKYYKVTNLWNDIKCINLGIDLKKRENMITQCNILRSDKDKFFYDGKLGICLPDIKRLTEMNIYSMASLEKKNRSKLRTGTIGLNVTQRELFASLMNNEYSLILEDDIEFSVDFYNIIYEIFTNLNKPDILYLGYSIAKDLNINDITSTVYEDKYFKINTPNTLKKYYKISIGGFFSVLLSKKAITLLNNRFDIISNISDILLNDLAFKVSKDFHEKEGKILDNDLITYFVVPKTSKFLINVDRSSSLTNSDLFNFQIPDLNILIKTKKINFIYHNGIIKINSNKFLSSEKIFFITINNPDIIINDSNSKINFNINTLNICIKCKNENCSHDINFEKLNNKILKKFLGIDYPRKIGINSSNIYDLNIKIEDHYYLEYLNNLYFERYLSSYTLVSDQIYLKDRKI